MFRLARNRSVLGLVFVASVASAQTEFSADLVDLQKPATPTLAKMYFAKDKRRIEMQAASGDDTIIVNLKRPTATNSGSHIQIGGRDDTIIIDVSAHTSTILRPQQKSYTQAPLKALAPAELYALYAFVQTADIDNACTEWMKRPGAEGESCRNVGGETINGRSTVRYDLSCYGELCHLWIDRSLCTLVKRQTKWNSTELRNIQEVPQPASLFEVPVGYSNERTLGGIIRPTNPQ